MVPTSCTMRSTTWRRCSSVSVDQVGADVLHIAPVLCVSYEDACPSIRLVPTSCTGTTDLSLLRLESVRRSGWCRRLAHRRLRTATRVRSVSVDQVGADVLHKRRWVTLLRARGVRRSGWCRRLARDWPLHLPLWSYVSVDQVGADVLHLVRLHGRAREEVSVDQVGADVLHAGDTARVDFLQKCPSIRLVPTSCTVSHWTSRGGG